MLLYDLKIVLNSFFTFFIKCEIYLEKAVKEKSVFSAY